MFFNGKMIIQTLTKPDAINPKGTMKVTEYKDLGQNVTFGNIQARSMKIN